MNRSWNYLLRKTYLMALSMFVALGIGINASSALAAGLPSFSAATSGTTNNLTLAATLNIADAEVGQNGNIYLGFNYHEQWFFHTGPGWTPFYGGIVPAYATGPLANRSIDVVRDADMSSLVGGQLYAGYGSSESEMLTSRKFGMIYTVVADTTSPTVTLTGAPNGATDLPINRAATAIFSEAMDPLTITAATFTLKQGATAVAGTVTYTGVTATFKPAADLAFSTTYTSTITTGVKDLAGNPSASNYTWSWTTGAAPDTTAPTVSGTIHTNGQTNVAINTKIGITFNEGMDPSTITNLTLTLKETGSGSAVAGTVSYTGVNAVFSPTNNLAYNTAYTVTVKSGNNGVKDLADNPLASDFTVSWTTGPVPDTTAPTVSGSIHANGATDVAINAKAGITFSEGMDPLTITNLNFSLTDTATGTAVPGTVSYSGVNAVFIPTNNLAYNAAYTVTVKSGITGVKDLAGNPLANDFVISWNTGVVRDTTAPTVSGTINANGATDVAINTRVGATFSEAMDPLTITNLNYTLKETSSGKAVAGTVSYSGVNAVFTPLNSLAYLTGYTVTVKSGISGVKDLAGNSLGSDFTIGWSTGANPDTTAPTVSSNVPLANSTVVTLNAPLTVSFSEAMDSLTLTTATIKLATTYAPITAITGTVSYDAISKVATFTPLADLPNGRTITATVTKDVRDLAGNVMTSDYAWTFYVQMQTIDIDNTAPTISRTVPVSNATNLAISTNVTATFSEAMAPQTINTTTFTLKNGVTPVTGTVTLAGTTATFTPAASLAGNTVYTATIDGAKDLAGNALTSPVTWTFTTSNLAVNPTAPTLGEVGRYAILASQKVTTTGTTAVSNGDIGNMDQARATYITGFTPDPLDPGKFSQLTNGYSYAMDDVCPHTSASTFACPLKTATAVIGDTWTDAGTMITQVRTDLGVAYNFLAAGTNPTAAVTTLSSTELGGTTLTRGVYYSGAGLLVSTPLHLDAQGDANSIFIITTDGTLTTGATGNIILDNLAQAKNVYWRSGDVTHIAADTTFYGNVFAASQINVLDRANVTGRLIAKTNQVTLIANTVTKAP